MTYDEKELYDSICSQISSDWKLVSRYWDNLDSALRETINLKLKSEIFNLVEWSIINSISDMESYICYSEYEY